MNSRQSLPQRLADWMMINSIHVIARRVGPCVKPYIILPTAIQTRFKLALTEDTPPTIKTYFEERWAELADSKLPIDVSIAMLSAIHVRWERLLRSMSDNDFQKSFIHPETGNWPLEGALALYAWHSEHHTAHITHLRERNGW